MRLCPELVVPLILVFAGQAAGATYYVDRLKPGNDANPGTEASPFLTIPRCVAIARNPGDTCLIKKGNYPERVDMRYSGTEGNPITVKNFPGHAPTLAMSGYTNANNRFELASADYYRVPISWIVIEGLEISGGYFGISFTNGNNLTIRRNVIHHNGQGILGGGYNASAIRITGSIWAGPTTRSRII